MKYSKFIRMERDSINKVLFLLLCMLVAGSAAAQQVGSDLEQGVRNIGSLLTIVAQILAGPGMVLAGALLFLKAALASRKAGATRESGSSGQQEGTSGESKHGQAIMWYLIGGIIAFAAGGFVIAITGMLNISNEGLDINLSSLYVAQIISSV